MTGEEERERKGGRERMDYKNEMEEMGCVTWSGGMVRGGKGRWGGRGRVM